jgi:hypothetical protein
MTLGQQISNKLDDVNTALRQLTCDLARYQNEITSIKLAQARQQGQIDMLWKIAALALAAAIAALIMSARK